MTLRTALSLFLFFIIFVPVQAGEAGPPTTPLPPLPAPRFDEKSYESTLNESRKLCDSSPCKWWHDYALGKFYAQHGDSKACATFTRLAKESDFPLVPFALIKTAENCAENADAAKALTAIKEHIKKNQPRRWLEVELTMAAMKAAQNASSPDFAELALKAEQLSHSKKNKAQVLQDAIASAKKLNDKRVTDLQDELYKIAPRFKPVPDDWAAVGQDAMLAHDYELGAKAFEKVIASKKYPQQITRTAFENLKTCYKNLQRRKDALKITERLYKWDLENFKKKKNVDNAKHLLASGLAFAKFQWTDHESHKALASLNKLQKLVEKKTALGELFYVRGRINEELAKKDGALTWLEKAINDTSDPALKSQYQWSLAWMNYKLGRFEKSRDILEEAAKDETDQGRRSQENFWLAKSLQQLKQKDQANTLFEQIIKEDPLGYYPLLAYRELERPIPKLTEPPLEAISRVPKKIPSNGKFPATVLDWLVSLGENKFAQELLDDEVPLPDANNENAEAVFGAYSAAGYFAPVFSRVNKLAPAEKQKLLFDHPEFLFPKRYNDFVSEGSQRSGLWPEYILSIMRQESSFDPTSISGANAYGLLQLLPPIARKLAKDEGVNYKTPEDLLDPQTNILLGARHLRNYWEEFDGQFILATAAYNASPEAVKNWVEKRYRGDALVFIEDIPYEETKTYVKLVLRNFIHYQRLNAQAASIAFPEWCLEGIHASKD